MSDLLMGPPRLKEQFDQINLAERIAGQVARTLPAPKPLSPSALARIAASIDGEGAEAQPRRRHRWAFATAAFLLGIATAASAKHLDVLPDWLTGTGRPAPKIESEQHAAPVVGRARAVGAPAPAGSTQEAAGGVETAVPMPSVAPPPAALPRQPGPPAAEAGRLAEPRASARRPAGHRTGDAKRDLAQVERSRVSPPARPPSAAVSPTASAPAAAPAGAPAALPSAAAPSGPAPGPGSGAAPRGTHLAFVDQPVVRAAPRAADPTPTGEPPAAWASDARDASKHLASALQALRGRRSPEEALQILDRHRAELAQDRLTDEATLVWVEAMVALGRRPDVLRRLDGMSLTDNRAQATQTLLLTRGKLRAAANRCAEGIGDLDLVLARASRPGRQLPAHALQALWWRAFCRKTLGDSKGAAADVERYRREAPGDASIDKLDRATVSP